MITSLVRQPDSTTTNRRSGPPVGRAFIAFTALAAALAAVAGAEAMGSMALDLGSPSSSLAPRFGVVASTTFAIASILALSRAISIRSLWAAALSLVLFGAGAVWCWTTFVLGGAGAPEASIVVATAGLLAIALLAQGFRQAHWLEVFGGLGLSALTVVASMVRIDPSAATLAAPALLAIAAGMAALYGILVDLEVAEHRSLLELIESRRRIEQEVAQVEDLLHDLRGGLLAIEAAIGSFDGDLAGPLRAEAARLRRLTLTGARSVGAFDLVGRVANLVAARRCAGVDIALTTDGAAMAWGEESEVLAIVDNLLTNAERHGDPGPIEISIAGDDDGTRLTVRNPGTLPPGDPDTIFGRGVTSHPDGQGLGLARARMLAEVNGADLRVEPAEAGHISFVLSLRSPSPVAA
ncbi:MAG: HAMP domain-containing sensor histidine kinase [Actinomycetota bacterium]